MGAVGVVVSKMALHAGDEGSRELKIVVVSLDSSDHEIIFGIKKMEANNPS